MSERDLRRVALFQYAWPLQAQTINLARALARAGVHVDLYIKDCRAGLVDVAAVVAIPAIELHDLSLPPGIRRLARSRVIRYGWSVIERIDERLRYRGVSAGAVREAFAQAGGRAHQLYIGIEKLGLIWAGNLSEQTGVPLVYYSLELYDDAYPGLSGRPGYARARALEKRFHARARATIVQDAARGAFLLRSNGLAKAELVTLPVSVDGAAIRTKSQYLRERFKLPPDRPVILYLGQLDEARGCLRIAELARSHGDRLAFVFHGYGAPRLLRRLQRASAGKALVSTDLVAPDQLAGLVSSADIGLALYRPDQANDRLTASSSEKVALYCQAGVPFIAHDNDSYRGLVADYRCAELVADLADIPATAAKILSDHAAYRNEAYHAFEARYRFEANAKRVIGQLAALIPGNQAATAA